MVLNNEHSASLMVLFAQDNLVAAAVAIAWPRMKEILAPAWPSLMARSQHNAHLMVKHATKFMVYAAAAA